MPRCLFWAAQCTCLYSHASARPVALRERPASEDRAVQRMAAELQEEEPSAQLAVNVDEVFSEQEKQDPTLGGDLLPPLPPPPPPPPADSPAEQLEREMVELQEPHAIQPGTSKSC